MKTKILYIITKADVGGAQKYVRDLSSSLNSAVFETKVLYGGQDIKWLSNKVQFFLLNDLRALFELKNIFKREQPHIIHLNSSKAGVIGALAAALYNRTASPIKKAKVIFTAHGWVFNPTNAIIFPIRLLYILFHKCAAIFQDAIICVSAYDYALAKKYCIAPERKLVTINNGIDQNLKFLDSETAKKEIIKKLSTLRFALSVDCQWIGSIGRLVKEKNYQTLIRAASLIPNAYFFIIGEGNEREMLNQQLKTNNLQQRFFLIDPAGEDARYLKAFDIFVMSSIKEGFPYILLEAMSAELPIVITQTGGMSEMITHNENGFTVEQKNPEALSGAITTLIKNKDIAHQFAKKAQRTLQEKFTLKKMTRTTSALYQSLL
ncbi:MAG: glycosyltransferase [bacterium]|nr:glycosyltransferase [bacterium]